MIPLLVTVRSAETLRRAAWLGWLAGVAFFGLSLHWIYSTCRFAGVPVPVSFIAWAALATFQALPWLLFALGARYATRLPETAWPWTCAALWAALEFAGARWTPRVGGDLLGYTQWRFLSWLQLSSVFGPHALGFLIVLVNASAAACFGFGVRRELAELTQVSSASSRLTPLLVALGLAGGWGGAGALSLFLARPPSGLEQRVAILQPNIDQYRKFDESEAGAIRATFDGLLADAVQAKPVLAIWPESSVPGWLEDATNMDWISARARQSGVTQLVGTLTTVGGGRQNAAVVIDPMGRATGLYQKRELVPFGEYVPLRRWLAPVVGILAQMGDLTPGPALPAPLGTPLGPAGVTLCYEAVFPRLTRASVAAGARWVANLTNDGWYKDTWGPWQHFYVNRFRAIENRVYLIRAGNTGISGVFDPWGRVTARLDLLKEGVLVASVPSVDPFPERSYYARTGDWFGWLALACAALALGAARLSRES